MLAQIQNKRAINKMAGNNVMLPDLSKFTKVSEFLHSRNLDYALNSFLVYKIDDSVAIKADATKLMEFGLVYGDIIAYRQFFSQNKNDEPESGIPSYKEKVAELKMKIQRTHSGRMDAINRPISVNKTYQVTFGIKCLENKKYKLKFNKSFTTVLEKSCNYDDLHQIARDHFQPGNVETYLARYDGKKLRDSFLNLETFSLTLKEKKKPLKLYLFYPFAFSRLEFKKLVSGNDDALSSSSDFENFEESITFTSPNARKICADCSCTYVGDTCLRCEQDAAFAASLEADKGQEKHSLPGASHDASNCIIDGSSDEQDTNDTFSPSSAELRRIRLQRFASRPVRFRHSIGESSPAVSSSTNNTFVNVDSGDETPKNDVETFGDEEVSRFLETQNSEEEQSIPTNSSQYDTEQFMTTAFNEFQLCQKHPKTVIVQRHLSKFWNIIFSQKFNMKDHKLTVRFAGEAAADIGGPYREFLTLCMKNFAAVPNVHFGQGNKLCFSANAERVLDGTYFKLGQIVAVAILTLGRGPECLHPAIVRALYDIAQPMVIEHVEDAKVNNILQQIENGDNDPLLDINILPVEKTTEERKRIYLLSVLAFQRASAIKQFKDGLASISQSLILPQSYDIMKCYLEEFEEEYGFNDFVKLISYPQSETLIEGSNDYIRLQDAVTEFELLIAALESCELEIDTGALKLSDLLFFITGSDRVPPHGIEKSVEVTFDDSVKLPMANTCGLNAVFPYTGIMDAFVIAMKFGAGFGCI